MTLLALVHVLGALALTAYGPLWLLLLAPLALGVPHVVADLRYLVLRPLAGFSPGAILWLGAALGAMTVGRGVALAGLGHSAHAELALGFGALLGVALLAPGSRARRVVAVVVVLALTAGALASPRHAALLLGHAHNLVALAFLVLVSRELPGAAGVPAVAALALAGAAAILGGALDVVAAPGLAGDAAGFTLAGAARTLAPGLPGQWGTRLVLAFAFLQALHYSVWVHLLPTALEDGRTLRGELEAACGEAGVPLLAMAVAAGAALPALGLVDPVGARAGYLSLVAFHGWLELAVLAQLFVAGQGSLAVAAGQTP
jgi:hypothetical protein